MIRACLQFVRLLKSVTLKVGCWSEEENPAAGKRNAVNPRFQSAPVALTK